MKMRAGKISGSMKMENDEEKGEGKLAKSAYMGKGEKEGMNAPKAQSKAVKEMMPSPSKSAGKEGSLKSPVLSKHMLHQLPATSMSDQDPCHEAAGFVSSKEY